MKKGVEVKSFGKIYPKNASNIRITYEHQKNAMENLDIINKNARYSTMIVLPTGGGKTYTASMWLLRNAIDKKVKVLWIAHRQMLLDQAAGSFQKFAYAESIPHIPYFQYRIISGASCHDRTKNIQATDDLLIVSKDSIGRDLGSLDVWLDGEKEIYLVIDEAHHSTAKTYRKVITYVRDKIQDVKLIGLTATPFRTADKERGLLAKIYEDGLKGKKAVHGDIGITYQIGLKELINRRILSKPTFENFFTGEMYGGVLGLDDWESIQRLDILPDDIATQMADSAVRNRLIVEKYKEKQDVYGQTIVFAINVVHAIHLSALFNKAGVRSEFIVSDVKDLVTGVRISQEENKKKLEAYRTGDVQVLVNVNILTEGVDLPQTRTVFLTRPTVSTILMTQMIGRALRGEAAGGTASAYIVSFVDDWKEHIAWVNPDSLFNGDNGFTDDEVEHVRHELRMIAISKIEEFASVLDDSVDTTALEKVSFEKRIPIGMYAFTYLEEDGTDISHQVMVYDSTRAAYEAMLEAMPECFRDFNCTDEYPEEALLVKMAEQCRDTFFIGEMIPPYEERDVVEMLKYYAQYEIPPQFYTFDDIDRDKINVAEIAKHIWDEDMGPRKKTEYVNSLWEDGNEDLLRLFFGKKLYFWRQLDIELTKLTDPSIYDEEENIKYGRRALEDLSLYEIRKLDPQLEKNLRDAIFERSKDPEGQFVCSCCGIKRKNRICFQVDHILPMSGGGQTKLENLQILCRRCNGRKGDKY